MNLHPQLIIDTSYFAAAFSSLRLAMSRRSRRAGIVVAGPACWSRRCELPVLLRRR
jgi:hypothetical protein